MKKQHVIVLALLCLLLTGATGAEAGTSLQEKFDSLFILASSGEVMFRDLVEPAKDSLAALGPNIVPLLIEKFSTKSARERWSVIHVLQRIGSPAVPDLVAALDRPDGLIVQRVCWALGDIKDSTATAPLVAIRNHERWQVRDQVAGALGKIGWSGDGAADAVMAALNDSIGQVRKAAAVACGKLGLIEAAYPLAAMLDDEFYGTRFSAQAALGKLDTGYVVEIMAEVLSVATPLQFALACDLLGQLKTDLARDLLWKEWINQPDPDRRGHVLVGLANCVGPVPNLGQFLTDREDDRHRQVLIQATFRQLTDEAQQDTP